MIAPMGGTQDNIPNNPDALSGITQDSYLLTIARRGLTRFISHLDWIVLLQQAAFRSRLPVALTEGYNKKLKAKYSPPLPTGVGSEAEFVQIWLTESRDEAEVYAALSPKFPPDIVLRAATLLPPPVPKNVWKDVTAARYLLLLDADESADARAAALRLLELCRDSPAVQQPPLAERRKARSGGVASYKGDEDALGTGGAKVPTVAARELFEEAGDPRIEGEEGHAEADETPTLDLTEHYAKVYAIEAVEETRIQLIGAFAPSKTLHPMRLAMALQSHAGLKSAPVPVKECVMGAGPDDGWRELFSL